MSLPIGFKHSLETIEKIRLSKLGKKRTQEMKDKLSNTRIEMFKKGLLVPPFKGQKRNDINGENHWNWKGGINPINDSIRKSIEFKLWAKSVKERDNFICKECGKIGGKIQAHHIKPFSLFPELRFAIDNGITLCRDCHMKTDTYAGKVIKFKHLNY